MKKIYLTRRQAKAPPDASVVDRLFGLKEGDAWALSEDPSKLLLSTLYFSHMVNSGKSQIVHAGNLDCTLLKKGGCIETKLPRNERGQITKEAIEKALTPRTALVSMPWADFETGVIHPIWEIADFLEEEGVELHVEATDVLGKLFFRFQDMGIDYLTVQEEELGLLLIRKEADLPVQSAKRDGAPFFAKLETVFDLFDPMCTEVARLRNTLEKGMSAPFAEVERLPNVAVIEIPGVHPEMAQHLLAEEGIHSDTSERGLTFTLTERATEEEITQVKEALQTLQPPQVATLTEREGMRLAIGQARNISLSLLVDCDDGIIADASIAIYGGHQITQAGEKLIQMILRKNYDQARRISADLLEKRCGSYPQDRLGELNLLIEALDQAALQCMDIPIQVASPVAHDLEGSGDYPNWEALSQKERRALIEEVIGSEIRPYIELDAGGIEIASLDDLNVTISYSGACTSCPSSIGSTLSAIQGILRAKVHPNLQVTPDKSLLTI